MKALRRKSKKGFQEPLEMQGKPVPDSSLPSTGAASPFTHQRFNKVRGIKRSDFAVRRQGLLAREWRGVKVPSHLQEVLNFVKAL